jgi:hypothetical protein
MEGLYGYEAHQCQLSAGLGLKERKEKNGSQRDGPSGEFHHSGHEFLDDNRLRTLGVVVLLTAAA